MKPKLKPPGTKRLRLNEEVLLAISVFEFYLSRYSTVGVHISKVTITAVAVGILSVGP